MNQQSSGLFASVRLGAAAVAGYAVGSVLTADLVSQLASRRNGGAVDLRASLGWRHAPARIHPLGCL